MTANQFQTIIKKLLRQHEIKVGRHYKSLQGSAYIDERKIYIPKPICETSFYIALHEIGHIATGIKNEQPNWLHEYSATKYALEIAEKEGVTYSDELIKAIKGYLKYCIYLELDKTIPNKVFNLAGLNKSYLIKQKEAGKEITYAGEIEAPVFRQWKNFRIVCK